MNEQFHEKKGMFLLLLGLLFVLLVVCFMIFLQPIMSEMKTKERQLNQTENDILLLEIEINNENNKDDESDNVERMKLANQLPEDPLIDELIVTLEEIESVSSSRIERIQFSYDGSTPDRYVELQEASDAEINEENVDANEADTDTNTDVPIFEGMPGQLQVIEMTLNVTSPNYDDFQTFIQEIEREERMMFASQLNFIHPGEDLGLENFQNEEISFDITIVTFYYDE